MAASEKQGKERGGQGKNVAKFTWNFTHNAIRIRFVFRNEKTLNIKDG